MGEHLDGSSIHDGIDVTQFHYYRLHTVGPDFVEDVFMTIVKKWDQEENYKFHNNFQMMKGI